MGDHRSAPTTTLFEYAFVYIERGYHNSGSRFDTLFEYAFVYIERAV